MVYHLHFETEKEYTDIFVRVRRPISFRTFLNSYVMDKTKLTYLNKERENLQIKNLKGVYELHKEHMAGHELSKDGQLSRTYEEID